MNRSMYLTTLNLIVVSWASGHLPHAVDQRNSNSYAHFQQYTGQLKTERDLRGKIMTLALTAKPAPPAPDDQAEIGGADEYAVKHAKTKAEIAAAVEKYNEGFSEATRAGDRLDQPRVAGSSQQKSKYTITRNSGDVDGGFVFIRSTLTDERDASREDESGLRTASVIRVEKLQDLKPQGYVNDFAGVLSPNIRNRLTALCSEVDQKAQAQIAVVTVHNLGGETVEDFTRHLANSWGVGHKSSRGVVILLAVDDHKYRIGVGYGLEAILSDAKVDDFGRAMTPALRRGDYGGALLQVTWSIASVIAMDRHVTLKGTASSRSTGMSNEEFSFRAPTLSGTYLPTATTHYPSALGHAVIARL